LLGDRFKARLRPGLETRRGRGSQSRSGLWNRKRRSPGRREQLNALELHGLFVNAARFGVKEISRSGKALAAKEN